MRSGSPLPATITVRTSASGLHYRLPWRRTPTVRVQALVAGLLGILFLAAGLYSVRANLGPARDAFGFLLSVASLSAFGWAGAGWTSRSTAKLTHDSLILTEWLGPFPLRRIRPLGHLRRLAVYRMHAGDWGYPPHNGVLEVACEGSQSLWFAAGYPCDLLSGLAADLAGRCGLSPAGEPDDLPAGVTIDPLFLASPVRDEDTFDRPEQPAGSKVALERRPADLTVLRVPPDSLPDPFGVLLLITPVLALFGYFLADDLLALPWPPVVPLALVAAVGGLVAHVCRRWTVLAVGPDGLSVLRTGGLLPPRQRHWPRLAIRAIRRDLSAARRRTEETCRLSVYLTGGRKVGLCWGRDPDELAWLATVLRRALGVPPVVPRQER